MTRSLLKPALVAAAIGALAAGTAFAQPVLTIDGTQVTLTSSALGYQFSGTTADGWATSGLVNSNSPDVNPGLDLGTFTATCIKTTGCSSLALTLALSDTDFATAVGANGFLNSLTGAVVKGSGSVTQAAYYGLSNSLFDMSGVIGTTSLGGSVVGGGPAVGPYSLTIVNTFNDLTSSGVEFSTDGFVTAVPEPGVFALFGAGLLGLALFLGRRRSPNV